MKKDAGHTSTRSRKKTTPTPVLAQPAPQPVTTPTGGKNVSPLESSLSVTAGVLLLVAALFPRSIKQLLLLGTGGFLVYRGTTSKCNVYAALGIDTARESLLKQINEKYLAPAGR